MTIQPLDLLKVNFEKSPNQSERKDQVRAIVLHHTGPGTFKGICDWLKNPESKAAAHYVIGTEGEITQLVNTSKNAWHAGVSEWTIDGKKRINLNHCTIGIEICNVGLLHTHDNKFFYEIGRKEVEWKGTTPKFTSITYPDGTVLRGYGVEYPKKQLDTLISLCKALVEKYPDIGPEDILTHYQVAQPFGRKNDPFALDVDSLIKQIFN